MLMRLFPLVVAIACLCALLGGCGGGGGNTSSTGGLESLTYATIWGSGAGPTGVSERISLITSSGGLFTSQIINKNSSVNTTSFTAVPAGTYLVKVELNNGTNFGGTTTGTSEIILPITSITSFTTKVGDAATTAVVSPTSATFTVQQSKQFALTAFNASHQAVFTTPGSITWSTTGGVATINSEGIAVGTNPGPGAVLGTYVPLAKTSAATINVTAFVTSHSKWTVLVYLNAANDLDPFGDLNVNQMEQAAGNPNVRFVVQWKQAVIQGESESPSFIGTRRYLLNHDTDPNHINSTLVQDMGTGVDMGSWQTLHDFVVWGQTFYPSDRTVLVIWNHGNGWHRGINTDATRGVSYDDDFLTSIQTWELNQALGTSHVDILAWDASLMQMLEVDNEIRDKSTLIVGSEESPPGAGYPYNTIFKHFDDAPDAPTLTLSKAFVDETLKAYDTTNKITQSVIEGDKLAALSTAVDGLGQALIAQEQLNPTDFALYIQTARLNAQAYSQSASRTYRDLIGLTLELDKTVGTYTPPASILTADAAVRSAAAAAILYEGHNTSSPGSHGIAIDFSPASRFVNYSADYSLLRLAQDTHWDEWLSVAP